MALRVDPLASVATGKHDRAEVPGDRVVKRRLHLRIWDGIIGVRGRVRWGETPWFTPYYLDVGAGSSNLTWQAMLGIAYGFKWGDVVLAHRTLFYDQNDDKLLQDFRFSGPTLGATFRF